MILPISRHLQKWRLPKADHGQAQLVGHPWLLPFPLFRKWWPNLAGNPLRPSKELQTGLTSGRDPLSCLQNEDGKGHPPKRAGRHGHPLSPVQRMVDRTGHSTILQNIGRDWSPVSLENGRQTSPPNRSREWYTDLATQPAQKMIDRPAPHPNLENGTQTGPPRLSREWQTGLVTPLPNLKNGRQTWDSPTERIITLRITSERITSERINTERITS